MPQTKNQKTVTQNKILFCSRFTAQEEIFVTARKQVGATQDSLISFLCLKSFNEMSVKLSLMFFLSLKVLQYKK